MNDFIEWFSSLSEKEQTEYFKKIEPKLKEMILSCKDELLEKPILAELLGIPDRTYNKPVKFGADLGPVKKRIK